MKYGQITIQEQLAFFLLSSSLYQVLLVTTLVLLGEVKIIFCIIILHFICSHERRGVTLRTSTSKPWLLIQKIGSQLSSVPTSQAFIPPPTADRSSQLNIAIEPNSSTPPSPTPHSSTLPAHPNTPLLPATGHRPPIHTLLPIHSIFDSPIIENPCSLSTSHLRVKYSPADGYAQPSSDWVSVFLGDNCCQMGIRTPTYNMPRARSSDGGKIRGF